MMLSGYYAPFVCFLLYSLTKFLIGEFKENLYVRSFFCWETGKDSYFDNAKIIFDDKVKEIKPKSGVVMAVHPHGILCGGWSIASSSPKLGPKSGIMWLGTENLFKLPLVSDLLRLNNAGPIDKASMCSLLKSRNNIALLPGGFDEASLYE